MQTIARANRVYDDEKENGLIVDYGNVYRQLEEAYSIYGEGGKGAVAASGEGKPVEKLEDVEKELQEGIQEVEGFLKSMGFELTSIIKSKPMQRIAKINEAVDAICLNETTRTTFEVAARNVFRKYKALFPEEQVKKHVDKHNAIEAVYSAMNENVQSADVIEIMMELQQVVDDSIEVVGRQASDKKAEIYVDLSNLDFDKLKTAFAKKKRKNSLTYNLQQAVAKKLEQMIKENPLRLEFYERYQEIIEEYNNGKDQTAMTEVFNQLVDLVQDMTDEELRHIKENLRNNEVLAIFDLLIQGKQLQKNDREAVKKVAQKTLDILKAEKLKIDRWRESRQVSAQVKSTIYENLLYLPQEVYTDSDVAQRSLDVYQHIYSNYYGSGESVYA